MEASVCDRERLHNDLPDTGSGRIKAEEYQLGTALLYKEPVVYGDLCALEEKVNLGTGADPEWDT